MACRAREWQTICGLLILVISAQQSWGGDPPLPAVLREAGNVDGVFAAQSVDLPEGGVNKDGSPLIQRVSHEAGTDAERLVVPDSVLVQQEPAVEAKVVTLELSPGICVDCCRHFLGLGPVEPFAPLSSSGTSHLDSALVGNRVIFRYDLGWGMRHPDRAEYYMARNRSVPAGGGRGLLRPETHVDAQELSTYLEMAFSSRCSAFIEMPARFLNLEVNKDYYGWGDLNAGVKFTYCVEEHSLMTALFRVYTPTGDAYHGLGTGHTTLEPGILVYERLTPSWVLELELKDWIPVDGTLSAGNVLRYGASLTCDAYQSADGFSIKPVAEIQGWTVLRGMQTEVYPTQDPFSFISFESENRDTIINGSLGVRCGGDKGDCYLGYTRSLTGPRWFESGLRLEFRLFY